MSFAIRGSGSSDGSGRWRFVDGFVQTAAGLGVLESFRCISRSDRDSEFYLVVITQKFTLVVFRRLEV